MIWYSIFQEASRDNSFHEQKAFSLMTHQDVCLFTISHNIGFEKENLTFLIFWK